MFVRSDLASRQRSDLETKSIECISIELNLGRDKWLIMGAYKPPSMKPETFSHDFQKCLDKVYVSFENFILLGDLNFDMLDMSKGTLRCFRLKKSDKRCNMLR